LTWKIKPSGLPNLSSMVKSSFNNLLDKNSLKSKDFFLKSYHAYLPVLVMLFVILHIMAAFYLIIRISILKSMRLYESVLEKSSARSDREQEMTNLKTKESGSSGTHASYPTSPNQNLKELQPIE
jgi:hypothetical protein